MRISDWSSDVCSSDLGDTLDAGFFGILIFEFVEREAAAIGDVEGARERRGIALVEPVHFGRGHQEAVGIAFTPRTERVDRAAVTGAGHDLLEHAAMRMMIEDVAGRSEEHTSELQSLMRISYAVFCLTK